MRKNIVQVSKPHKTPKKWAWLGDFKPNVRKIEFSISLTKIETISQINTKFDRTLKTANDIVGGPVSRLDQIQDGGRPPF